MEIGAVVLFTALGHGKYYQLGKVYAITGRFVRIVDLAGHIHTAYHNSVKVITPRSEHLPSPFCSST